MMFTIEFFALRKEDNARATLARVTDISSDLESAKVRAKWLFDVGTLNMRRTLMACGFWTKMRKRCSFGHRGLSFPRSGLFSLRTVHIYFSTPNRHIEIDGRDKEPSVF